MKYTKKKKKRKKLNLMMYTMKNLQKYYLEVTIKSIQ